MRRVSFQNFSLLGAALLIASSSIAAVTRNQANGRGKNGMLRNESGTIGGPQGIFTCKPFVMATECTATYLSSTTIPPASDSYTLIGGMKYQTMNNTSLDGVQSVLQLVG